MAIPQPISPGEHVPSADQRLVSYGVPWSHFEAQLALRGEAPVPRMAYLEGALELMTPSRHHERIKSYIGRLIEAFALAHDVPLAPYGGWTLKNPPEAAGLEPDECYIVGEDQTKEVPDLAIEVVWTSGGLDKLEIYRRLAVGEVWFWKEERLEVYVLIEGQFETRPRSRLLPELDLPELASHLHHPTLNQAVKAFRAAFRPRGERGAS